MVEKGSEMTFQHAGGAVPKRWEVRAVSHNVHFESRFLHIRSRKQCSGSVLGDTLVPTLFLAVFAFGGVRENHVLPASVLSEPAH